MSFLLHFVEVLDSARATIYFRRVASLRSHVERYILKLKQFRILSGVIPLTLKPVLDRMVFVAAALSNLSTKPICSSQLTNFEIHNNYYILYTLKYQFHSLFFWSVISKSDNSFFL